MSKQAVSRFWHRAHAWVIGHKQSCQMLMHGGRYGGIRCQVRPSRPSMGETARPLAGRLQRAMPAAVSRRSQTDAHSGTAMLACMPLEAHWNQGSTRRSRATLYAYKRLLSYVGQLLHTQTEEALPRAHMGCSR